MTAEPAPSRRVAIIVGTLVVLAVIVVPRFMGGATHEAQGTITDIDPATRQVAVEVIDPANGSTREFSGAVPADCAITLNGKDAALADLRIHDTILVRARIEHGAREPGGKETKTLVAERIEVTRRGGEAP